MEKELRKFFGTQDVPVFDYDRADLDSLALSLIKAQTTITGVQPKLSLHIEKHAGGSRLTIVGLQGDYIFKPQCEQFRQLPENEYLTMTLANIAGIATVPFCLIQARDLSYGYITKRIDRKENGEKVRMEDLCQLTQRMTEHKYNCSYEQVARTIAQYSGVPKLDVILFFRLLIFCFLTGNNDMHLKNFSLYENNLGQIRLSPAYDLINVAIVNPADDEQLALSLNGKKKGIVGSDFIAAAAKSGIGEKTVRKIIAELVGLLPKFESAITSSMLSEDLKSDYTRILKTRQAAAAR